MNEETYLIHHGIKGQKWGVRRFQNADGSLTIAGRKRYGGGESSGITERKGLTDSQKEALKKAGKAALIAGGVAAAGYLYASHADEINDLVKEVGFQAYQNLRVHGKNAVSTGKSYVEDLAKQAYKGAMDGIKQAPQKIGEGVKEGLAEAPKKVAKAAVEGAAIIATKKLLESTIGKDKMDSYTQAYNAYNKKNKVGQVNSKKKEDDDDE